MLLAWPFLTSKTRKAFADVATIPCCVDTAVGASARPPPNANRVAHVPAFVHDVLDFVISLSRLRLLVTKALKSLSQNLVRHAQFVVWSHNDLCVDH